MVFQDLTPFIVHWFLRGSVVELVSVKQLLQCWGIVSLVDDDKGAKPVAEPVQSAWLSASGTSFRPYGKGWRKNTLGICWEEQKAAALTWGEKLNGSQELSKRVLLWPFLEGRTSRALWELVWGCGRRHLALRWDQLWSEIRWVQSTRENKLSPFAADGFFVFEMGFISSFLLLNIISFCNDLS